MRISDWSSDVCSSDLISGIGQSPVDQLLALLETEYVVLLTRLSAHVRSPDVAAEIIHDVYVKLRSEPAISEIHSPRASLYRMAVNLDRKSTRLNSSH